MIAVTALANTPTSINVQGRLTDASGTPLPPGVKSIGFRIFNQEVGGTQIWPAGVAEVQSITSTADGLWTAYVGALDPLTDSVFADSVRWLEIAVDDGVNPLTILPRVRLVTGPYAHRVSTVDGALGGTITSKLSIGPDHTNQGINAFVAGEDNIVNGNWATVSGGSANEAGNIGATIAGGTVNYATGTYAFVGGGNSNRARGERSVVAGGGNTTGGDSNAALGDYSAVVGGRRNIAADNNAFIGGGTDNLAGPSATVGGGNFSRATGVWSVVAGGGGLNASDSNSANGTSAAIGGGRANMAAAEYTVISGGQSNIAEGESSTIGGGEGNYAGYTYAVVAGGALNQADSAISTISGGLSNYVNGRGSTIGGGESNEAGQNHATVAGGVHNTASADQSSIGGGHFNLASNLRSTVAGGVANVASGIESFVGGGDTDSASGANAVCVGGELNAASGDFAFVGGGKGNKARGPFSFVGGGSSLIDADSNVAKGDHTVVVGGRGNLATGQESSIGGGANNTAAALGAVVPGGVDNYAGGSFSFAGGRRAQALHNGSFVWNGNNSDTLSTTGANQFLITADGGVGINTDTPEGALDVRSGPNGNGLYLQAGTQDVVWKSGQNLQIGQWDGATFTERARFTGGGRLGINETSVSNVLTLPNIAGVDGRGLANRWDTYSSRRWKHDIVPLDSALQLVRQLQGVRYKHNSDNTPDIGLIAEDVGAVIPEIVQYEDNGIDARSVDYARLVAVLIEAVKEQQSQIHQMAQQLEQLTQ